MTLGEYINLLESFDPDQKVAKGLGNPHSWRGRYDELALEPVENTTVGKMLEEAKAVLNTYKTGYKGGKYLMDENVTINIERYGNWTDGTEALNMLFELMLGIAE